jgi:hypothetical protein
MKKESFWNMLEQTEPDIIIASETWLHQGILEREVRSHPASNIVFMMVLLIGIVYLFPFIDVVSHSMSGRLASPPIQMVASHQLDKTS